MAANATDIRHRSISVKTRGVRCHENTVVADDSCGGAKNWWKGNSTKYHTKQPLYNNLELLMMGIVMPETS